MAAKYGGDLVGHLARVFRHAGPAVAEGDDSRARAGVVPVDVAPARFGGMSGLAVEFHGYPELPVLVIEIAGARAGLAHRLPSGSWEPVRPFDASDVAKLQARMGAIADIAKRAGELGPPAQFRPGLHRGEQEFGGYKAPRARSDGPGQISTSS
jgi:hypothetical protein